MTTQEQQRFIEQIAAYVRKYAPQYGILVNSTIIAQAINESGWGTSDLAQRHNYFGLKAGNDWTGRRYSKVTKEEYTPGEVVSVTDTFRVYDSMEDGVRGYFEFLNRPAAYGRYDNLKGITDPIVYAQTIKDDGYCTRSNYVEELTKLINQYNLTQYDSPETNSDKAEYTVTIQRKIVAPGHGTFASGQPTYFAVHSTANPGTSAYNHTVYWSRPASQGGGQDYAVHFVSDWKEAYQCVELTNKCWQVGNGNYTCIGLEICEATNQTDFLRGLEIARSVILQVLDRYGWDIDGHVRSHKWFTETYGGSDHVDPIPYFKKWGWTWEQFIQFLKEGESDMTPEQSAMLQAVYAEVTRRDDPTGRGSESTTHEHIKWFAPLLQSMAQNIDRNNAMLEKTNATLDKIAAAMGIGEVEETECKCAK